MKYKIIALIVVFCILITGCNQSNVTGDGQETQSSQSNSEKTTSDPVAALDEIYATVEIMGVEDAGEDYVEETIGISKDDYKSCYIRKTDGRFGIADVYIIEPTDALSDTVQNALTAYRDKRVAEAKDYNIYNAYEIAQDAEIFQRGKYVVMVMLEDAEGAVETIKKYISAGR